jgi:hypothetical protein
MLYVLYKKYLTNWGIYAYLTNGDMCDREIWMFGDRVFGDKMITRLKINVLYYPYKLPNTISTLSETILSKIYLWIT